MNEFDIQLQNAIDLSGGLPGSASVRSGETARRYARRSRVPDAEECEAVLTCHFFGRWRRYFVAGVFGCMSAGFSIVLMEFVESLGPTLSEFFLVLYRTLPLILSLLISVGLVITPVLLLANAWIILHDRRILYVGVEKVLCRHYHNIRRTDTALDWDDILAIEWVKSGKGFETQFLTRNETSLVVADGDADGTLWVARFLGNLTDWKVTGNIPFPALGDKITLAKAKKDSFSPYPAETEIIRGAEEMESIPLDVLPDTFSLFSPDQMEGSKVTAGVFCGDEDEPKGFVIFQDLKKLKKGIGYLALTILMMACAYHSWRNPSPNGKEMLFKYISPLLLAISIVTTMDLFTGKIWLIFTPDRLLRKREWCRLLLPVEWQRSAITGFELFRSVIDKTEWVVKVRWRGNAKERKDDIATAGTFSDAVWLAAIMQRWSGAPIIERPDQRPAQAGDPEPTTVIWRHPHSRN